MNREIHWEMNLFGCIELIIVSELGALWSKECKG
jgi:hypothetical protein